MRGLGKLARSAHVGGMMKKLILAGIAAAITCAGVYAFWPHNPWQEWYDAQFMKGMIGTCLEVIDTGQQVRDVSLDFCHHFLADMPPRPN
jgi:hypothetical protein